MPKGDGVPLRARKLPITDDHVRASVSYGMDENGHYGWVTIGGIPTMANATVIKQSLHRCGTWLGYSITSHIEISGDAYQVRFKAIDKAIGRAYIAAKKGRGEQLAYNPFAVIPKEQP